MINYSGMHFLKQILKELAYYMPGTKRCRAERTSVVLCIRERCRKRERPSLMESDERDRQ